MGTNIFIINFQEKKSDPDEPIINQYRLSVDESVSIPIQEHNDWFFTSGHIYYRYMDRYTVLEYEIDKKFYRESFNSEVEYENCPETPEQVEYEYYKLVVGKMSLNSSGGPKYESVAIIRSDGHSSDDEIRDFIFQINENGIISGIQNIHDDYRRNKTFLMFDGCSNILDPDSVDEHEIYNFKSPLYYKDVHISNLADNSEKSFNGNNYRIK